MKKILAALLLVSTVIGMTGLAMANPENAPIAVSKNYKDILVQVDGSNVANSNVAQTLFNTGNQNNAALGIAVGGNAAAGSQNIGVAGAGASAVGQASDAQAFDNTASNTQSSSASASGGSPEGFGGDVYQINAVIQYATASIQTDQSLGQTVDITDIQNADATDPATQNITDSSISEDGWRKVLNTTIN